MLEGYKQALSAKPGVVPPAVSAAIKQAIDKALLEEAQQVHSTIQYVRDAIKPARTKEPTELGARPMQKIAADFDLFCAQLNTKRGLATFGVKPSAARMWTFALYEQGQLATRQAVAQLIERMFLQPETEIQYFYQDGSAMDAALFQAIDAGDILLISSEFRYFKHPEIPHDYIKIERDDDDEEWRKDAAEFSPEFVKTILELSARKRAELDTIKRVHLEDQVREQQKKRRWSYDVFLSYSDRDKEQAASIHEKVAAVGGRLFMAPKEISPGDDFADTIRNALVHSRELWLLVSPDSVGSEWAITEWGAAWALKKRIVPILYRCDHSKLPLRLRSIQTVDLHQIDELVNKTFPKQASGQN
jgi:hypothetical protein